MTTDIEVRLTADVAGASRGISSVRKEYSELVTAIQKPLKQIPVFRDLETRLEATGRQARAARERVRDLGNELARAEKPSKVLSASYRRAVSELNRLERMESAAKNQLASHRRELQSAGIDTSNLVVEQQRLGAELESLTAAWRADTEMARARGRLAVGRIEQEQRALVDLRSQYRLVMADANLSAKERAEAEAAYRRSVAQTLAQLRQLRTAVAAPVSRADQAAALEQEAAAAAEAAEQNKRLQAQRTLGVGIIRNEQRELLELRRQVQLVRADTALSATQRAEAEATYRRRVSESLAELRKLRAAIAAPVRQSQIAAVAQMQRESAARSGIAQFAAEQKRLVVVQRQSAIEAARNDFGVNRARAAVGAIQQLEQQFKLLKASGGLTANELAIAQRNFTRRVEESRRALAEMNGEQKKAAANGGGVAGQIPFGRYASLAGAGYAATTTFRAYVQASDSVKSMEAQLRLATSTQEEFNRAQEITREIATQNMVPLQDTVKLYSRLSVPMRAMGRSQADTGKIIDIVAKSLRISGASATEAASTIQQFSQALGSGVLRGEEFNSMAENSQRLLKALADGMKVPVESLRDMASEGKLTSNVIVDSLLPQWEALTRESEKLPDTVGGQFVVLKDQINLAMGGVNTQPLIDQMKELGKAISEENTAENIGLLGAAFVRLGRWGTIALSNVMEGLNGTVYSVSRLMGNISEFDRVEQEIRRIDNALNGVGVLDLFYTDEELKQQRKQWEDYREQLIKNLTGLTTEERKILEDRKAEQQRLRDDELESLRKQRVAVDSERQDFLTDLESSIKAQEKLEKKALGNLDKIRSDRAAIERKYSDALAKLGGTNSGPSYAAAQDLKVAANQALRAGDFETAKKRADEALKMLLDLREAGGNGYGLEGFAKELQKIELAASDLEKSKAENSLEDIRTKIAALKTGLDELKDVRITVSMSDEEVNKVLDKMNALAERIGKVFDFQLKAPVLATDQQLAIGLQAREQVQFPAAGLSGTGTPRIDKVAAKEQAAELGKDLGESMVIEPKLKRPEVFQDGSSFSQFPPVEVKTELDGAAAGIVQNQITQLAQQFQQQLVIPVTPVLDGSGKYSVGADDSGYSQFTNQGFSGGGWTGPGGKYAPAGLVHADEHVQPKEVVNEPGALAFLEQIRRFGFRNTMSALTSRLRGYAQGGLVRGGVLPSIPAVSPESLQPAGPFAGLEDWGTATIRDGDSDFQVLMRRDSFDEMVRLRARQAGRSSKRRPG